MVDIDPRQINRTVSEELRIPRDHRVVVIESVSGIYALRYPSGYSRVPKIEVTAYESVPVAHEKELEKRGNSLVGDPDKIGGRRFDAKVGSTIYIGEDRLRVMRKDSGSVHTEVCSTTPFSVKLTDSFDPRALLQEMRTLRSTQTSE